MAHQYQSKFLYQRASNPLGEYLRPTGFGTYTLGSLSNRPGKDWATPRYVRDEPDRFMSGYGADDDIPDDETGYGVPDAPPPPPAWDPFSTTGGGTAGPWVSPTTQAETEVERAEAQAEIDAELKTPEQKSWWEQNKNLFTAENALKALQLVKTGVDIAAAGAKVLVGSGSTPIPPPIIVPGDPAAPIPIVPVLVKGARRATNDQTMAMLYHRGLVKAAELSANARRMVGLPPLPTASKSTVLLLVGAAAVAFLVLRKKK